MGFLFGFAAPFVKEIVVDTAGLMVHDAYHERSERGSLYDPMVRRMR